MHKCMRRHRCVVRGKYQQVRPVCMYVLLGCVCECRYAKQLSLLQEQFPDLDGELVKCILEDEEGDVPNARSKLRVGPCWAHTYTHTHARIHARLNPPSFALNPESDGLCHATFLSLRAKGRGSAIMPEGRLRLSCSFHKLGRATPVLCDCTEV